MIIILNIVFNNCSDDPEFTEVIRQAEAAIDVGVNPTRIYQVHIDHIQGYP